MSTRHKNVRALLRSGQEAGGLFLYVHEMCVGPGSAIVLVGSVSGASLHVTEAGEKGRGLLQLDTAAAETTTHSSLHFRTDRELNHVQVQAPLWTIKTIKQ